MIIELLSPEIYLFLEEIERLGFSLCLVGGITRDYFYTNKLSVDLDFEIRSVVQLDDIEEAWPLYYKKLINYLREKKLNFTELPYLITRVNFAGKHFEFSSPRTEIDQPGNFSHHHFQAILDPQLSFEKSFRRRDFTINAIGIELKLGKPISECIIDPYLGLNDLKKGILRNITEDFFLDSVRFLRLIRFKQKFENFSIEEKLFVKLNHFNLTKLSVHHFTEELFKSRPTEFLNYFSHLVNSLQLKIPETFKVWTKYTFPKYLLSKEEILAYVFLQNEKDAIEISAFFLMPEKKLRDLKSFNRSYQNVLQMTKDNILCVLSLPVEDVLKHSLLKDLKNLDEKKEWNFILNFEVQTSVIINLNDWKKSPVSSNELNVFEPALRSYYQYYKTLKKIFLND